MGNYFSHCLLSGVQQVSKWDLCDLETIVWEHWQWTKTVKLQAGLGAESYYEALWSGGGLQIQIIILCGFITASDRFQLSTTAQFLWWWCNSAPKPWHPISIIAPLLRQLYAHDKVLSRAFMQSFFFPWAVNRNGFIKSNLFLFQSLSMCAKKTQVLQVAS